MTRAGSPDVVVVGGGFAGLAAATALADAGARVLLCEARPHLGGRARSWTDPDTGSVIDNGQHLFAGCYDETLRFLERIGARDRLHLQERLEVPFVEPGGHLTRFSMADAPGPAGALLGLLRAPGLGLKERLGMLRVALAARRPAAALDGLTVRDWLTRQGQTKKAQRRLWEPLSTAVLNEDPSRASALGLAQVLRRGFLAGGGRAGIGLARVGLSDLYVEPATQQLRARGAEVRLRAPVLRLLEAGSRCAGVLLAGGVKVEAEAVIACVPPGALLEMLPPALAAEPFGAGAARLGESAIVSVYLWFGAPVLKVPFAALLDGFWHWIFDRGRSAAQGGAHAVTLVRSAANPIVERPKEALVRAAIDDLKAFFPDAVRAAPRHALVIKEKSATVSLGPHTAGLRPGPRTPVERFFLAGDWTATGLPATIEGAVASGHAAARLAAGVR